MNVDAALPLGWTRQTLEAAVGGSRRVISGPFGSNLTQADYVLTGVPVIRGANMGRNGRFIGGEFIFVSDKKADDLSCNIARPGDIVVTQRGTVGQVSIIPKDIGFRRYVISQSQMAISVDGSIDRNFLYSFLNSPLFAKYVRVSTNQTGLPHINLHLLRQAPLIIPTLPEQQRIAKILAKWDESIDVLDQQINRKEQIVSYLQGVLMTGLRRLGPGEQLWPIVTLGEVTQHLTARNGVRYSRERVMGVTKAEGLVPMRDHIIAADLARYLILPPQAFAYNPMRINIGSITMSEAKEEVIVSPDYVVFACRSERCHPRFLNHLRRTRAWQDFMSGAGNGSVRVRIYYADLADFEFHLPSLQEQERIAQVLDDADREVSALRAERRAREKQRNALATELLTGRIRVPNTEQFNATVGNEGA